MMTSLLLQLYGFVWLALLLPTACRDCSLPGFSFPFACFPYLFNCFPSLYSSLSDSCSNIGCLRIFKFSFISPLPVLIADASLTRTETVVIREIAVNDVVLVCDHPRFFSRVNSVDPQENLPPLVARRSFPREAPSLRVGESPPIH